MPACGSEGACLQGLWTSKTGVASPQCLGSPPPPKRQQLLPRLNRQQSSHHHQQQQQQQQQAQGQRFYLLGLARKLLTYCVLAPALWLSCWLWLGWLLLRLPLAALRLAVRLAFPRLAQRSQQQQQRRRCVLIGGGGSVQAVQLARNLSSAGARVLVCELEGPLGLARFSSACSRYFTLPRPGRGGATAADYVTALKAIVERERVGLYVPVSGGAAGYLDCLAKPHLELLGCECFGPGPRELAQLEDPLELLRRAREIGLPEPEHRVLGAGLAEAAASLYEAGRLRAGGRQFALPAGPAGLRERGPELQLPLTLAEFARQMAQQSPERRAGRWLVLRDPGGEHFVTCTTLRDSRLLANVTCRLDEERGGCLVAEERPEVERWLERFCARGLGPGLLSGHLSFRLAALEGQPEELVPLGCRVGLGLSYLGHTSLQARLHAKLLWSSARPCSRHQRLARRRDASGTRVLDQRQALFHYSDPLPYCIYCYLQLPFRRLVALLGARPSQHQPPLAVVQ
ncbi:uncharacterized protein LOC107980645 [Nasonia vitripennis]|uniref:Uncharacterized protein n=1 Tax=Nasonia vitripennis TaxID=7425 RepID=A0A7M7IPW1_NASVI|nr:uncharacterized protein LOC107980645 [Nasonia vitripennis]